MIDLNKMLAVQIATKTMRLREAGFLDDQSHDHSLNDAEGMARAQYQPPTASKAQRLHRSNSTDRGNNVLLEAYATARRYTLFFISTKTPLTAS